MYKSIVPFIAAFLFALPAFADENPFFNDNRNQIMFNLGQGVNSFGLISMPDNPVPFNMIQIQYSQPTEFFRMPARKSLNFIQTIGYGKKYQYTDYTKTFEWNWSDYTIQIALLSEDIILYNTNKFYFGTGLSIGVQGQENERIGTKLLSGFKLFTGYKISKKFNCELFMQHFSNGSTDPQNYSYNFWGLGFGYNF
ncbi:MAG: acyloxyacyl hydrolase [Alphaproteobacteria bacterium]|nr:acyloxyacyl hydrolase [Alphaproteobacteria bacterium]MBN2675191.1 acyloxyacyl hydrolase [Alphaproteobacteria bacterium]